METVRKSRDEVGLTNEQFEQAVLRGVKSLAVLNQAVEEGVLTIDDLEGMPSLLSELEETHLESDSYAAAMALGVLVAMQEGQMDKMKEHLLTLVADHYRAVKGKAEAPYPEFRKGVEKFAESDPLFLGRLKED
ncbi:MAG: hypothetical protein ACON4R_10235 [Akkermansiaceae bacterium]